MGQTQKYDVIYAPSFMGLKIRVSLSRHGYEADAALPPHILAAALVISWQHCERYLADDARYFRVWMDGKTGGRWLITKHELAAVLRRLHSRQRDVVGRGFDTVAGRHKGQLFRTAGGRRPIASMVCFVVCYDIVSH